MQRIAKRLQGRFLLLNHFLSIVTCNPARGVEHQDVRLDGIKAGNRDQDLFQGCNGSLTSRFS